MLFLIKFSIALTVFHRLLPKGNVQFHVENTLSIIVVTFFLFPKWKIWFVDPDIMCVYIYREREQEGVCFENSTNFEEISFRTKFHYNYLIEFHLHSFCTVLYLSFSRLTSGQHQISVHKLCIT